MNPKQFLLIGGAVLVLIAILGFVGIIGPTPDKSIFGATWWFDNAENWAHLVIGIAGVISAYILPDMLQKYLTLALALVALFFGVYSLLSYTTFLGANLENPADSILHLAVGVWALYAAMMGKKATTPVAGAMMQK